MDRSNIVVTNEKQYTELTAVTWNFQTVEKDIAHCLLGISSELGEIESAVKKNVGYNKTLDLVNIREEFGDLLYFTFRLSSILKLDLELKHSSGFHRIDLENIVDFLSYCNDVRQISLDVSPNNYTVSNYSIMINLLNRILSLVNSFGLLDVNKGYEDVFEIMTINIRKLAVRFPDKFDSYLVVNRDLIKEREILDGNGSK